MKKIFPLLFFVVALVQSCIIRPCEPCRPPGPPPPPPGGQPWWYSTENGNSKPDSTNEPINEPTNEPNDNPNDFDHGQPYKVYAGENPEALNPGFVPTCKYDSTYVDDILTFNVYLGWDVDQMETIVLLRDYSKLGGEIDFNIYTNNLSMSMYEFMKYEKEFYEFSSEPPYCGYSSYSLDTRPVCKYKLIVKENDTNSDRICHGYWSCNRPDGFYSQFKILLYQCF